MWILLIFYIESHANSQMSVEFNTKEACMIAAAEWRKQVESSNNLKMLCAFKGEKNR